MTISIGEADLPRLFSGKAIVLVDRYLAHLVPTSAGYWDTLTFHQGVIGTADGKTIAIGETRLPLAAILIVQRTGSQLGRELVSALRDAGHPSLPRIVSINWWQAVGMGARAKVATALNTALEEALVSDTYSPREMNRQITALRQQLELERANNDRMGLLLSHLGWSGSQLAIDNSLAGEFHPVSLPRTQDAPGLRNLKQIALYDLSNVPSQVKFELSVAGRPAHTAVVDTPGKPGWLTIPLPESLVQSAADATFHLQALSGEPQFAASDANLACRLFWNESGEHTDRPSDPSRFALGTVRRPRRSGILLGGVWLEAGATVFAETDDTNGFRGGRVDLVPHGQAAAPIGKLARSEPVGSRLELATAPSLSAGRYDVMLSVPTLSLVQRELAWRVWATTPDLAQPPRSFAAARFATLRGAMEYCDGPRQEESINSAVGFPVLSAADGQPYMQTHPVDGHVVGAVFPQLVGIGTTRIWVDVENAHRRADAIEFIVAVRQKLLDELAQDWLAALPRPKAKSLHITDLPNGDLVARVTLRPGTAQTLDIQLPRPLLQQSHLYCLVSSVGASSRYGWCRWNSIAFAIDEDTPLPVSP